MIKIGFKIENQFNRRWILFLLILMTLSAFTPLYSLGKEHITFGGTTYYVSPKGNNSNPGTLNAPFATPGYGSRKLKPGDTLVILYGKYILSQYDEDVLMPKTGKLNSWIRIKGEGVKRPVLAGRNNLAMAINLSGVSHILIENIEITHDDQAPEDAVCFRDGIVVSEKPADHIILKDLYIHHIDEFGLNFQDIESFTITNCQIEYTGFGSIGGPAGQKGGWRNIHIEGCRLSYSGHYYQGGDGTNRPYDRPDGFGIESSAGPINIVNTVAEHNRGDGLDSKAQNTEIRQCIVANNSCDGIKLWGDGSRIENTLIYGRGDGNPENTPWSAIVIDTDHLNAHFEITNVTIDDQAGGNYLIYVQYDHPDLPISLKIQNTIFCARGQKSPISVSPTTKLRLLNNLFYFPRSELILIFGEKEYNADKIRFFGRNNLYGDPLFMSPAFGTHGNYQLKQKSPAINAGANEGAPAIDLKGRSRDARPDIGAYETGL